MRHDNTIWQDPNDNKLSFVLGKQLADNKLPIQEQVARVCDWLWAYHPDGYAYVLKGFPAIAEAEHWTDKNIKDEWHIYAIENLSGTGKVAWYFDGLDTPYEIIETIWKEE